MFFVSYCQRLISGSKTVHYAASPLTFHLFLMFPRILSPLSAIEGTHVASLPCEISSIVLLVVVQTKIKFLKSAKILWRGLSENLVLLSDRSKLMQKNCLLRQPRQNTWHKVKKYSKIGNTSKMYYQILNVFWLLLSKFKFCKQDWGLGCVFTHIWHFSNISSFSKMVSLKLFSN